MIIIVEGKVLYSNLLCEIDIQFRCFWMQEVGVLHRVLSPLLLEVDVRSIFT